MDAQPSQQEPHPEHVDAVSTRPSTAFPIVGIGASAGGLQAVGGQVHHDAPAILLIALQAQRSDCLQHAGLHERGNAIDQPDIIRRHIDAKHGRGLRGVCGAL